MNVNGMGKGRAVERMAVLPASGEPRSKIASPREDDLRFVKTANAITT